MTSDRCRCQRVDVIVMLWNTGVGNPISIEMKFMSKTTGNVTTTTHAQMSCPGAGLLQLDTFCSYCINDAIFHILVFLNVFKIKL